MMEHDMKEEGSIEGMVSAGMIDNHTEGIRSGAVMQVSGFMRIFDWVRSLTWSTQPFYVSSRD